MMLLILTHENADFDAAASQLAAHKLYPEGVPLLSRRVNRNVHQFLALYWDALPFMRPDDWQRRRIQRVVLVDTQSLPSVRGLNPDKVTVQVIDHHELVEAENGSGPQWQYRVERVGATTTLLVEMLEANGLSLSPIEATMLLLGIHEDTGSLVYDTTTSRDVHAAGWLLDQGAQLSMVRRFLEIPLSAAQRALYEQLQQSAVWHTVKGQAIVVAKAVAEPDFNEEISAIAHYMRDALAPDGLIILVQLKENHIQLVARSVNRYVNVAALAQALGGGGHGRAAAATIIDGDLADIHRRVIEHLPQAVTPMVKVGQIMSYGLQTLPANATVREAATRMQRFGHEGYPVVDPQERRLIGLLTRRAVDRAMSHKLERLPVSQVMKAGRVTVRPSDSIDHLQRLMIQEGWGQIPVVADESEDGVAPLIGIVTRTDLLNLLSERTEQQEKPDMRRLLARMLPPALWQMVKIAGATADELRLPLYFVGGLVRDLLLDKEPTDIDMVVEGDAIRLANHLRQRYGGQIRSHARFGTAKWLLSAQVWQAIAPDAPLDNLPEAIDFVTARTEFYTQPSALPEVERSSIKLDLHRRDFTINTLAVRLDGAHLGDLLDFYGGQRDLEEGVIRVLHSLSFVDDPTRILRAARLEQRLGFTIEPRTEELIRTALPMLDRVTGDRIRHELQLSLWEEDPAPIMERLDDLDVLSRIHPELCWPAETAHLFSRLRQLLKRPAWRSCLQGEGYASIYLALWLTHFSETAQRAALKRLRVRKTTRQEALRLHRLRQEMSDLPAGAPPSEVVRLLRDYQPRVLLAARAAVDETSPAAQQLDQYQTEWRRLRPALDGHDLQAMGLAPGPQLGEILEKLRAARLDGEVATEAEERALVERLRAK